MNSFNHVQRVRVVSHDDPRLIGMTGSIVRIRKCDDGAWVRIDDGLPVSLAVFPRDDDRHCDILLYPEHCAKE